MDPLTLAMVDGCVHVSADLRAYRLLAIQKAAYRFAARCTVLIGHSSGTDVPLTFTFERDTSEHAALAMVREFFRELLDQELREQIGGETREIRALILAHAFSRTGLVERE